MVYPLDVTFATLIDEWIGDRTLSAAAPELGVPEPTLSRWRRGKAVPEPDDSQFDLLRNKLKVPEDVLDRALRNGRVERGTVRQRQAAPSSARPSDGSEALEDARDEIVALLQEVLRVLRRLDGR